MMNKKGENLIRTFLRTEELSCTNLDEHGRHSLNSSELDDISKPIISQHLKNNGFTPNYPKTYQFAACLTHDIDDLFENPIQVKVNFIKDCLKGRFSSAWYNLKCIINKKNNKFWNLKTVLETEKKYNAKSSYYFLALNKSDKDYNYNIEKIKDQFKLIKSYDCEIGLHGGHGVHNNITLLKKQKEKLEKALGHKVIGYRSHYLKFKCPTTWENLKSVGIKYDVTLGYHDQIGFRSGICYPYKPYNELEKEYIDILEIPLIVMDCSLDNYLGLDLYESFKKVKEIIDEVKAVNGVFNIVWHNSYFIGQQLKLYEKILQYLSDSNAWLTSGVEIYDWWNKQNIKTEFLNDLK